MAEKLLDKIRTGIVKRFGRRIERIDVSMYRESAPFRGLCAFLELELEDEEDQSGDHNCLDVLEEEEGEPEVGPTAEVLRDRMGVVSVPSEDGSEEGFVPFYTMLVL